MPDASAGAPYMLVISSQALRALERRIPPKVAYAIYELITGPLLLEPYRIGKPLSDPVRGLLSARKGTYRIVYRVKESSRTIEVLGIDHRADIYRPHG